MPGHTHFDESTEEYLEAIYRLEREGPGVTTSGLATELGITPASVSGMLKKLAGEGYIDHRARGEAKLTRTGLEIAVRVLRRHRLAECLLTNVLGMSWDEVHSEACRLEHAISDKVEARLVELLNDPKVCPHGHPIPPLDLSDPPRPGVPLAQMQSGEARDRLRRHRRSAGNTSVLKRCRVASRHGGQRDREGAAGRPADG